jgi:phosphoribosylformylglycinamidine cyclo-ligase
MSKNIYTQDGVDVELGNLASQIASKHCKATYNNSDVADVVDMSNGNFRGPRLIKLNKGYTKCLLGCAPDGTGTKSGVIDAARSHKTAAFDLMAMTSFDLVRFGGLPVYFTSVLDVESLGEDSESETFKAVTELYQGLENAAKQNNIIVLNGETAELPGFVSSDNPNAIVKFNWGGSVQGIFKKKRMITGKGLKAGQVIIAMRERGFRSNGLSSVRSAFAKNFGKDWFSDPSAEDFIKMAAEPSVLYDNLFTHLNGWGIKQDGKIKIHSIIHLTGGSFESKLGKDVLFPRGLSAVLDDLWEIPYIMKLCAEWRGMKVENIYDTWNAGQGALAIIDKKSVKHFMKVSSLMGMETKVAGFVTKDENPNIRILPKLLSSDDIIYTI